MHGAHGTVSYTVYIPQSSKSNIPGSQRNVISLQNGQNVGNLLLITRIRSHLLVAWCLCQELQEAIKKLEEEVLERVWRCVCHLAASMRGDRDVVENVGAVWVPQWVAIDMWLKPSCNIIQTRKCITVVLRFQLRRKLDYPDIPDLARSVWTWRIRRLWRYFWSRRISSSFVPSASAMHRMQFLGTLQQGDCI